MKDRVTFLRIVEMKMGVFSLLSRLEKFLGLIAPPDSAGKRLAKVLIER